MKGWFARWLGGDTEALEEQLNEARAELQELRIRLDRYSSQLANAVADADRAEQALSDSAAETESLRGDVQRLQDDLQRATHELDDSRGRDTRALEEMIAEVDRERAALREREAERERELDRLRSELRSTQEAGRKTQAELERERGDRGRLEGEFQHINNERQRLLREYGQLCAEAADFRQAKVENEQLKEQVQQLRREAQEKPGKKRGGPPVAAQPGDADEIRLLRERVSALEKQLLARGTLLPLAALPPQMQQMFAGMGENVDPSRILSELWDRLMEQETRLNSVREDSNRRTGEADLLRAQLFEVYGTLVTPVTVLSATTDLLMMERGLSPKVQRSFAEMKQTMSELRQALTRLKKLTARSEAERSSVLPSA